MDVVYVDIAQPDQTKIAIDNCKMYLKKSGFLFLVIKTRSIDVTKDPKRMKLGPYFSFTLIVRVGCTLHSVKNQDNSPPFVQ